MRELFNALRHVVRTGCTWRYLPHDLPPWAACYQQWARWRDARVFEALTDDLRQVLRLHCEHLPLQVPLFSIRVLYKARLKVATVLATTELSAVKAVRCT